MIQNSKFKIQNFQEFFVLTTLFLLPFYFIKFKYHWVSLNLIEILILALLSFWIFDRDTKYQIPNTLPRRQAGRYQIPVTLILGGVALSIIVNKNYYIGLGILKGWFILPIVFALIFYNDLKKNEKLLDWSLAAFFWGGAFVSVEGIYYWINGLLTYDGRLKIFYDSPNQLAMCLAPLFLIGVKLGFEELRAQASKGKAELWKAGLIIAGTFLVALNLYLTRSYGAWFAISSALAVVFWLKYRKNWYRKHLFIIIIISIILFSWAGFSRFEGIKNLDNRSSLASREMIWKSAGLMIKSNPFFGIGPGNFQNKYLEYQKYFPPYLEWAVPQPHNLFLAFWLEAGVIGLIGFIWLLVLFFRDNKKAIENNRLYGTLYLAIILYFLFHGLIDTTYWRNDMAILFWMVVAINVHLARNQKASP